MTTFSAYSIGEKLRTKSQRNARKITENLFKAIKNENTTGKVRWVVEKLFWVIVYLTGIVLTILTCIDLYQDYQDNPLSVTTELIQVDSVTPPDITVCLPFFNTEKLIEFWLNHDYMSVTNPCLELPNETQNFTLTEKIESIFSHTKSWKEAQEMTWEPPLLYVAQQYLAAIYEAEFLRGNDNEYLIADMLNEGATDNSSEAIIDHLIPKMREWNVTIKDFKKTFGYKFREFMPIYVALIANEIHELQNIKKDVAFITKNQICYKLGLSQLTLNASTNFFMTINKHKLRCFFDSDRFKRFDSFVYYLYSPEKEVKHFYGPVTVDFSGKERAGSVQYEHDDMFIVHINRFTQFSMKPIAKYQYEPVVKGKMVCSVDETLETCQAKCLNEDIQKLCHCTPNEAAVEQEFEMTEKRECLLEEYTHCLLNYTSAKDHYGCMNECLDWCTRWMYNISKSVFAYHSLTQMDDIRLNTTFLSYDHAAILLSISKFKYLLTSESALFTTDYVIGNIGGAFGFWLGLDIIVIVYTPLTVPVLLLLKKIFKRKNNDEEKSEILRVTENDHFNSKYWLISAIVNELKLQLRQIKDLKSVELVKWIAQKLTWYLLFVIGAGLTIKQYVELCQAYGRGGTQSITTVMINKSISLPPSAFCIPSYNDHFYLICGRHGVDGLYRMPCYLNGSDFNLTNLLASNETWPLLLIIQSLSFSKAIFLFSQGKYSTGYTDNETYNFLFNATQSLLEKYNMTNDVLFYRAMQEFMRLKNITATCYQSSENKSVSMLPSQVTIEPAPRDIYSDTSLCFHFPLETFEFYDENDYCFVSFRDVEIESVTDWNLQVYWAFKSPTSSDYAVDLALSGDQRLNMVFGYTTIYQYETNCVPGMFPADCLSKCRNQNMEKISINCTKPTRTCHPLIDMYDGSAYGCDCLPSTPDSGYCFNPDFVKIEEACRKECEKQMCTQYTYKMDIENSDKTEDSENWQELNIRVRNFNYPLISEVPVMTSGEFLSASGGLLGFYLGLDATFLVSVVITPLMFLFGAYLKKSSSGIVSNNNTNTIANSLSSVGNIYLNYLDNLLGVKSKRKKRISLDKIIERLFWSVIYFIFGAMTFIICIQFFREFRDNPVDSSSSFNREEELTIPVTLCVSLLPSELEECFDYFTTLAPQNDLFLKDNPFTRQLIDVTEIWSNTLLRIVHLYLINIEKYKALEEIDLAKIWKSMSTDNTENDETLEMNLLGSQLERENITHYQLLQKFGQELQRYYYINIIKHAEASNGSSIYDTISVNQTSFVSASKVCYKFSKNLISFSSYNDYVNIQIDKSQLPNSACSGFLTDHSITLDFLGSETGSIYSDFGKNFSLGEEKTMNIKIGDVIQMLPEVGGESRCSETTSKEECKDNCRRVAIEQQCNCSLPREKMETESTLNSNGCTWPIYERCLPHFSSEIALDCIKHCPISCKFIRYEIDAFGYPTTKCRAMDIEKTKYNCRGKYILRPSDFFYQISMEKFKWSFFSFVAELGGLLGIFLGIDILWFIDSFFAIAHWVIGRFSKTARKIDDETLGNNAKNIKTKTSNSSRKSKNAVLPVLEESSL